MSASVDDDGVIELLAAADGGGQDRVDQIAEQYRLDPESAVLRASIAGDAVGVVGYTVQGTEVLILHVATREDLRRSGVGRRMLDAVRDAEPRHLRLVAETDSEAVGFYVANGFVAESLGEKFPGVERFHVHALTADGPPETVRQRHQRFPIEPPCRVDSRYTAVARVPDPDPDPDPRPT